MNVCGIVAEYNPFHNGHRRHIERARERLGAGCAVVSVMSGNFVQRGAPAAYPKHARAEAALRCGVDLVLELPLPWALSSAERFAAGAASLLDAAGVVTHLSFGSESGKIAPLAAAAEILLRPELDVFLRAELATGIPYAAARQRAAEKIYGAPLPALERPNDILGIEYLKALRRFRSAIEPLTVPRAGAGHDAAAPADGCTASASWLRSRMAAGEDVGAYLPPEAAKAFARERMVNGAALETALLSRLRALPLQSFAALPDAAEGIENRLYRAARSGASLDDILAMAKTKRFAMSRLRRMLWGAALGVRREDVAGTPPYLRVLGADAAGRALLARMRERAALPVLTKPAAARSLDAPSRRVFALEAGAAYFYALGYENPSERRGGAEWRRGPVML